MVQCGIAIIVLCRYTRDVIVGFSKKENGFVFIFRVKRWERVLRFLNLDDMLDICLCNSIAVKSFRGITPLLKVPVNHLVGIEPLVISAIAYQPSSFNRVAKLRLFIHRAFKSLPTRV